QIPTEPEPKAAPEAPPESEPEAPRPVPEAPKPAPQEVPPAPEPRREPAPEPEIPVEPEPEPQPVPEVPPKPTPEIPPAPEPQREPAPKPEIPAEPEPEPKSRPEPEIPAEPEPWPQPAEASPPTSPLRGGRAEGAGGGSGSNVIASHTPIPTLRVDPPHKEEGKTGRVTVAKKVETKAEPQKAPEPVAAPRQSWFQRMRVGLSRSSRELTGNIAGIFTKRKLDEDTLQDLEDVLIRADLGVETAIRVTDALASGRYGRDISDVEVRGVMAAEMEKVLTPVALPLELDLSVKPHVILVVGVNGTGKTTTIGKLAAKLTAGGLSVMLAAGDTFRAAAIEQLKIWGERTKSPVVASKLGADAAGLAYDAFEKAKEAGSDVLIIDTAGRLQNRAELMAELEKIVRVLGKLDPEAPHTVLQT